MVESTIRYSKSGSSDMARSEPESARFGRNQSAFTDVSLMKDLELPMCRCVAIRRPSEPRHLRALRQAQAVLRRSWEPGVFGPYSIVEDQHETHSDGTGGRLDVSRPDRQRGRGAKLRITAPS